MPKIPYNKRKDGRYYKQIIIGVNVDTGKRKVKTLYSRDWRELDKKVRELQINLEQGKCIQKNITLDECIKMWWREKVDISSASKYTYKTHLAHVKELLSLKLTDIKPMHIQKIYSKLYEQQYNAVLKALPSLLHSIFDFAVRNDYLGTNIIDKVTVPKLKTGKRRALTEEEKSAVDNAFNDFTIFEKALVGLFLYTGMRRGEVLDLKFSDIDFANNIIFVKRTLSRDENSRVIERNTTKSPAGIRQIPLVPRLKEILTEYCDGINYRDGYLFLTRNNTFYDSSVFTNKWKHILKKINKYMPPDTPTKISPHYFRHNYATDLIYAELPLKTVQYIMGHENIQVTMNIYTDVIIDNKKSIEKLNDYWNL
ncbi:MAG: tyrosine-type recombinase/integrase [Hominilimicola sp.]